MISILLLGIQRFLTVRFLENSSIALTVGSGSILAIQIQYCSAENRLNFSGWAYAGGSGVGLLPVLYSLFRFIF
jgi:hypothetical protein